LTSNYTFFVVYVVCQ